jgi:WD40 repeat protein
MTPFSPISPANASALRELSQAVCGFITDIAWSPDGFTLALAHGGGLWLYEGGFSGTPSLKLTEHDGPVKSVAFNPTGMVMVSGSTDTTVRLWLPNRGRSFYVYRGHTGGVNAVAVSPNGRVLASAGGDREIRLFDMRDSAASNVLRGHSGEITCLGFGLEGRVLLSGGWDNTARLWAMDEALHCQQRRFDHPDWVRDLAVTPDGKHMATACKDGSVYLFNLETCEHLRTFAAHVGGVDSLAFHPSGALLATGGRDNAIRLWDVETLLTGTAHELCQIDAHNKPILALAFHPAGMLLASGSGDNSVRLWGVRDLGVPNP